MSIRINMTTCCFALLFINPAWAEQQRPYDNAYAQLQACMAEAQDVVDNGSYERYCLEAYEYQVKVEQQDNSALIQN